MCQFFLKTGQGDIYLVRGNTKKYNEPMTPSPGTSTLSEPEGVKKCQSCRVMV